MVGEVTEAERKYWEMMEELKRREKKQREGNERANLPQEHIVSPNQPLVPEINLPGKEAFPPGSSEIRPQDRREAALKELREKYPNNSD